MILGVLSIIDDKADDQGRRQCSYTRVDNGDPYRAWLDSMVRDHGGNT